MTEKFEELLAPLHLTRLLSVSVDSVRAPADVGKLPVLRAAGGARSSRRSDVELVAEKRKLARREHGADRK